MPFQPKYPPEQRAAIVRAVRDEGRSVPKAVNAAKLGELGPAFTMTLGAAYSMLAKEREERRPPEDIARDAALRILKRCQRDIAYLERQPQPLQPAEVRALRELLRVIRQAELLLGDVGSSQVDAAHPRAAPPSLAARIAADALAEPSREQLADDETPGDPTPRHVSQRNGHPAAAT